MQRRILITLLLGFAWLLLAACSNADSVVRRTVEDAAKAVEGSFDLRSLDDVEPFFTTTSEGANEAGLEETWGALQRFADSLPSSDRVQFHSFEVQNVEVHEEAKLAKVTYRLHLSVLRGSEVMFGVVVTQNLALLNTPRGWRISGGDTPQLSEITGQWPPLGSQSSR